MGSAAFFTIPFLDYRRIPILDRLPNGRVECELSAALLSCLLSAVEEGCELGNTWLDLPASV
jgi:hypothetical protein